MFKGSCSSTSSPHITVCISGLLQTSVKSSHSALELHAVLKLKDLTPVLLQRSVIQIVSIQFLLGIKESWHNKLQVNTNKVNMFIFFFLSIFKVLFDKVSWVCAWRLGGILLSRHAGKVGFTIWTQGQWRV